MTTNRPDKPKIGDPALKGLDPEVTRGRRPPPVENWHPAVTREIDMRIAADGSWYYLGTPINRPAMVRLFASILRFDDDGRHYLVTPVEKCAIAVDDAPFLAVSMTATGSGAGQSLQFVTNTGDEFTAGRDHPIRFCRTGDTVKPYVTVRAKLEALVNRAVFYDMIALCQNHLIDDKEWFGLWSGGIFWPIAPAGEIGETA